jgi:hypothetical protein
MRTTMGLQIHAKTTNNNYCTYDGTRNCKRTSCVDRWQPRGRACAFQPWNHPASHRSIMEPLLSISHRLLDTNSCSQSKQNIKRKGESYDGLPPVGSKEEARRRSLSRPPRLSPKSKSHAQPTRGSSPPLGIYRRWSEVEFSFKSENLAPLFRFPLIIVFSPLPQIAKDRQLRLAKIIPRD